MKLYRNESSHALDNAQRNLMGRTHYVDPDTLKFHKSRVLSCSITHDGLLLTIVTSDALDMNNTKRGIRFIVFDVFGTVVSRQKLEDAFKRREQCDKAKWAFLNSFDAIAHTRAAADSALEHYTYEIKVLYQTVTDIEAKQVAS